MDARARQPPVSARGWRDRPFALEHECRRPGHPQRAPGTGPVDLQRAAGQIDLSRSSSTSPRCCSTATAAHAPLPQASVQPAPRSCTRRRRSAASARSARSRRCCRAESAGGADSSGPSASQRADRPDRRRRPPHADCPSTPRRSQRFAANVDAVMRSAMASARNGMRAGAKSGSPMSTVTSCRAEQTHGHRTRRTRQVAPWRPAPARRRGAAMRRRSARRCRIARHASRRCSRCRRRRRRSASAAGSMLSS